MSTALNKIPPKENEKEGFSVQLLIQFALFLSFSSNDLLGELSLEENNATIIKSIHVNQDDVDVDWYLFIPLFIGDG